MEISNQSAARPPSVLVAVIAWVVALAGVAAGSAWLARHWLLFWMVALVLQISLVVPLCWHLSRRRDLRYGSIALAFIVAVAGVEGMGS